MTASDRSRAGYLVHSATANAEYVNVVPSVDDAGNAYAYTISCRTPEQAAEFARVLSVTA